MRRAGIAARLAQVLAAARAHAVGEAMRGCAALLTPAQALSTTTLKPPRLAATEKQVIACVDRVQPRSTLRRMRARVCIDRPY